MSTVERDTKGFLKPKDIVEDVRKVLSEVVPEKKSVPYLTAYQILDRLNPNLRARLIRERGTPGKDAGAYYTAVSVVSDAADLVVGDAGVVWLETSGLGLTDGPEMKRFGSRVCRLYRLPK